MATDTAFDSELTLNGIVELAYVQAGMLDLTQTPTAAQYTHGLKVLDSMVFRHLEAKNVRARVLDFETVTLEADENTVELGATTLEVLGDAKYIGADQDDVEAASSEFLVRQITHEQWQAISNRSQSAMPTEFYVVREQAQLSLMLWPTPNEAGSLRLRVKRLMANGTDGTTTADSERYWQQYFIYELAFHLAPLGFNGRSDLRSEADRAFLACRGAAAPRQPRWVRNVHRTGWEN